MLTKCCCRTGKTKNTNEAYIHQQQAARNQNNRSKKVNTLIDSIFLCKFKLYLYVKYLQGFFCG